MRRFLQDAQRFYQQLAKYGNPRSPWEIYKDYIKIHPTTLIDEAAFVRIFNPQIPSDICLSIGEECHIFSTFSLLLSQAKIRIGKRCQLGASQFICAESIDVGDDVIMGWGVTVIDSDNHSINWNDRKNDVRRCRKSYLETKGSDVGRFHDWSKVKIKKVTIGDKCWIGFNAIILKGVTIGEGAVIGAGSVVTSDVKPWHVGAGNPFSHIGKINGNDEI